MILDNIERLPTSQHKDVILIVDNRFTEYGKFLKHSFTVMQVVELFLKEIKSLHGSPNTMVSDKGKVFTSQFWQHLLMAVVTQLSTVSKHWLSP